MSSSGGLIISDSFSKVLSVNTAFGMAYDILPTTYAKVFNIVNKDGYIETDWISSSIDPEYKGWYEVKGHSLLIPINRMLWYEDGVWYNSKGGEFEDLSLYRSWYFLQQYGYWRGITNPPLLYKLKCLFSKKLNDLTDKYRYTIIKVFPWFYRENR